MEIAVESVSFRVKDKIAMVCAAVVAFCVLVAVFAGVICDIFGVSTDTRLASGYLDALGKVERVNGELFNVEFDKSEAMKDPAKAGR